MLKELTKYFSSTSIINKIFFINFFLHFIISFHGNFITQQTHRANSNQNRTKLRHVFKPQRPSVAETQLFLFSHSHIRWSNCMQLNISLWFFSFFSLLSDFHLIVCAHNELRDRIFYRKRTKKFWWKWEELFKNLLIKLKFEMNNRKIRN